jgi:transcriptional regulator with PAS, ATPase and Fis domain
VGGVDFISKPFQEREVLARVNTHTHLRSLQLQLEELVSERNAQLEAKIVEQLKTQDFNEIVLASMADSLAVLDAKGVVVTVNLAWLEFARANGGASLAAVSPGASYLDVCRRASDSSPDAEKALHGIESVLDRSSDTFQMEYDCHSPTQKRWFRMTVVPLKRQGGVVITHSDITAQVGTRETLKNAVSVAMARKNELQAEARYLREEVESAFDVDEIVGGSLVIRNTLRRLQQVAGTDTTVLLLGETGTGKELLARAIHARSARAARALVKVDCSNLPSGLIESELFGHEKGAFTGAVESRAGRFELADGGTILLDEIGELPLELQAKLLRVLEEGTFQRLGSKKERHADVRVIASTNRDLKREVDEGRFRADLYYRLAVFPIESPPLRERREDIPLLVDLFVARYAAALGKTITSVDESSMEALVAYDWPGNIRELKNVIERSVILCSGDTLRVEETLGPTATAAETSSSSSSGLLKPDLQSIERSRILRVLEESGWRVKGPGFAADLLGLSPSTLRSRMKRLGIARPKRS